MYGLRLLQKRKVRNYCLKSGGQSGGILISGPFALTDKYGTLIIRLKYQKMTFRKLGIEKSL